MFDFDFLIHTHRTLTNVGKESGQVISYSYWQLVSRSVRLSLEPQIVTCCHILAWQKISALSFLGRPPSRMDGTARYRGHSLCLCHVYVYHVLILLLSLLLLLCTCQACQSGHCAADYAYGMYLWQFRHWMIICLIATECEPGKECPTRKLTKGGVLRRAPDIVCC
jgi:hypothetical protein